MKVAVSQSAARNKWGFFMFKNWEQCKSICFLLSERMEDSIAEQLMKKVKFAEALNEKDRPLFIFNHLRIACTDSGLLDFKTSFGKWLKKEIKEMNDMIEYYKVNMNGRTV